MAQSILLVEGKFDAEKKGGKGAVLPEYMFGISVYCSEQYDLYQALFIFRNPGGTAGNSGLLKSIGMFVKGIYKI